MHLQNDMLITVFDKLSIDSPFEWIIRTNTCSMLNVFIIKYMGLWLISHNLSIWLMQFLYYCIWLIFGLIPSLLWFKISPKIAVVKDLGQKLHKANIFGIPILKVMMHYCQELFKVTWITGQNPRTESEDWGQ